MASTGNSMGRGAKEEVFETPDATEDDPQRHRRDNTGSLSAGTSATSNKVHDAEMVSSFIPPQAAFEVFMGRTYAGAREDMSDTIGASSTGFEGAVYTGEGYHREAVGGGTGVEGEEADARGEATGRWRRTGESPIQRLVRLREETALLARDLEEMSKMRRKGGEGGAEADEGESLQDTEAEGDGGEGGGGYALWSAMARETDALKRQLALISGDPKFKHIISSSSRTGEGEEALQQRLSEGIMKALEGLRETGGEAKNADTGGVGSSGDGSVTYELFLKEASEARKFFGTGDGGLGEVSKVEARIAALEKALGGDGSGVGGTRFGDRGQGLPLVDAVASLEDRVAVLEPGKLDILRQKAQLAKAELDSLAKSRTSSSSASSSLAGGGPARHKKIEEAYATLQTWQAVSASLPALVDRLRALESLHLASTTFAQRLQQVELCQSELVGVLKRTSDGVEATRESAAENVAIVDENIKALDRRIADLGLSS